MTRATRLRLQNKLTEEAQEASHVPPSQTFQELADILEALSALTATTSMSWAQLRALADDKHRRRSGFGKRIFLEFAKLGLVIATAS